jgi:hypothetical protein
VKLIEMLCHLHPRRLQRILLAGERRLRRQLRFCFWHTIPWFWHEIYEFARYRFSAPWRSDIGSRS